MTIKDIAQLAGVSISTVSKIINGKDEYINPQTRDRVLQIVKEYNFTPYSHIKSNASGKNFILGVLLRHAQHSSQILNGILSTAQEHGYGILLLESMDDQTAEKKHITKMCRSNIDGLIWEPINAESIECSPELDKHHIPFCVMNAPCYPGSYMIDYETIGFALTTKLIENGHTNIACLLQDHRAESIPFLNGFQKCLYENNLVYSKDHLYRNVTENFISDIQQLGITGVVSSSFDLSSAAYRSFVRQHFRIPDDCSLITLSENDNMNCISPELSALSIPVSSFGNHICLQLIQICEKAADFTPHYLFMPEVKLCHKKSIGPPHSSKRKSLLCIGAIHKDTTFNVNMLPQLGNTSKILNAYISVGGKGANQSIGIKRLGHEPSLIASVGNDYDATFILNSLENAGISTDGVCRCPDTPTGQAYIYLEADGESAISILPGANNTLAPQDIKNNIHLFDNASFCLLSGEISTNTVIEAASTAREQKVPVIFKPTTIQELPGQLCQCISIFVPNEKESSDLCPYSGSIEQRADYFFNLGIPVIIITLGGQGCYVKTAQTAQYFPAVNLNTVDMTGGADAFISALACYLCDGYSLNQSVQIAMTAAAFCISKPGASSALIDKDSLELYISRVCPDLLQHPVF